MRLVIVPLVTRVWREQLPGRQLVGRAGAPQRGQHVELPRLQVVRGERRAAGEVEVPGQPADAESTCERRDVEVGALALPGLDDPVDLVRGLHRRGSRDRGHPRESARRSTLGSTAAGPSARAAARARPGRSTRGSPGARRRRLLPGFGASSHHCPVSATMPTSICAYMRRGLRVEAAAA